MNTQKTTWILSIWAAVIVALWAAAVPDWLSLSTLVWVNGSALALTWVLVSTLGSGSPTRSIAHVLYDAEQPATRR